MDLLLLFTCWSFQLVQALDQVVVEIVEVPKGKEYKDRVRKDALDTTDIGEQVKNGITLSLNDHSVEVHFDRNFC